MRLVLFNKVMIDWFLKRSPVETINICSPVSVYFIQNRPHPPLIRSICSFKTCHEVNLLEKLGFQSVTGCLRRNALDQEV